MALCPPPTARRAPISGFPSGRQTTMEDVFEGYTWRPTNAPTASRRTDDIWFHDDLVGWAVNSNGNIIKTSDGGKSWVTQAHFEETYLRCVGFADEKIGWVGTFNPNMRLIGTQDGGQTWRNVENLPAGAPAWICGLCVVNASTVYAAGTNDQTNRAAILKTMDGGESWTQIDMDEHAATLVDIYFKNDSEGWVVGGIDAVKHPNRRAERGDLVPAIFRTIDGGNSWVNKTAGPEYVHERRGIFPQGEWCWKIQVIDDQTIVVSNQNYRDGAILRSDDGGETWKRLRLNDKQRNSNLEGVGFLDGRRGWVGGWGDLAYRGGFTSLTTDGGENWSEANEVGFRLNRFRLVGTPTRVVYASGDTVYKYTDEPLEESARMRAAADAADRTLVGWDRVEIPLHVPVGTERVTARIWDRSGAFVILLMDERVTEQGARTLVWDFADERGQKEPAGAYLLRLTFDNHSESFLVVRRQ
ncbi:hypothetical protein GOL41_27020 [Sinorhizobium medicae]|nr:hypothetical protein [Sinorhizobium medicae]